MKTDFLVIGSGVAGLSFALKIAKHFPKLKIFVITKSDESESNTKYAQGGIAVTLDKKYDSFKKHVNDTLRAGDGLCDRKIVDLVIKEGPSRFLELLRWGAVFDKMNKKSFHYSMEGGHTARRILHFGDTTGLEIENALIHQVHNTPNIKILSHYFAIDLITEHHLDKKNNYSGTGIACFGAYVLNLKTNRIEKIVSKITLLATGGAGQIYRNTTNPLIATGDGIAMAFRAGAEIKNMEFIQFHPTALHNPEGGQSFLISEAVRGFGALLRKKSGRRFLRKYDTREELASRDIVARAIDHELKKSGDDFVYLDCRHLKMTEFIKHFPAIYKKCTQMGIDVFKEMIPVVPAAHYLCGGVETDVWGRTNIENLYACGECACTGLHGANRLASNSLLEAIVFSHRCYRNAVRRIKKVHFQEGIPDWDAQGTTYPRERITISHNRKELQETMSNYVGIVRSDERLKKADKRLTIIDDEVKDLYYRTKLSPQLCELRNMADVASLVIKQSMERRENAGVFYNINHLK